MFNIKNIYYKIRHWFLFKKEKYYLYNFNNNYKNLLIISNILFFIFGIYFFNNKKYIEFLLMIIVGSISSTHHYNQCHCSDISNVKLCYYMDIFFCSGLFLLLVPILYNKLTILSLFFFISGLIFFLSNDKININLYFINHSIWHIFIAIFMFLILNVSNNNEVKKI